MRRERLLARLEPQTPHEGATVPMQMMRPYVRSAIYVLLAVIILLLVRQPEAAPRTEPSSTDFCTATTCLAI